MPVALAGAAVIGLSLLLSVGPALGAGNNNGNGGNGSSSSGGGNGTSGNVKVHDAGTGVETAGSDNEPHVCDFWLGFTLDAPFEAGTWVVVSWPPTGDGSSIVSGVYDTSGDGVDSSDIFEMPAGHYRVEWTATGATVNKKKTFWVDADCDETVTPADEPPADEPPADEPPADEPPADEPPADEPPADEPPADEPPADEPPADEPPADEPPADEPPADEPPADEPPAEESVLVDDESPIEDPVTPSDESPVEDPESPAEGSVLAGEESSSEDPGPPSDELPVEEPASPAGEPVSEDPDAPSDESPATTPDDTSDEQDPGQAVDPGTTESTETAPPPMENQLTGNGTSDEPTMADTAARTLPVHSGIAAAFGVLLLIVLHATIRHRLRRESRA